MEYFIKSPKIVMTEMLAQRIVVTRRLDNVSTRVFCASHMLIFLNHS